MTETPAPETEPMGVGIASPGCRPQARGTDLAESLLNAGIGLVVSWAATFFVLGYSAAGSAGVTLMFFTLSFARAYALRAIFRRME